MNTTWLRIVTDQDDPSYEEDGCIIYNIRDGAKCDYEGTTFELEGIAWLEDDQVYELNLWDGMYTTFRYIRSQDDLDEYNFYWILPHEENK